MKQYLARKKLETAQYYTAAGKMPCKGGLGTNEIKIMQKAYLGDNGLL